MTATLALIIAASCLVSITAIVFYKTIITRAWRNKAPREQQSWNLWVFYYNPQDERLFLPKRTGLGWTINFAQPLAIVMATLLVIGIIALSVAL